MNKDDLYKEIEEQGSHNYWSPVRKAVEKSQESNTMYGSVLIGNGIGYLSKGIKRWVASASVGRHHDAHPIISMVDPDVLAGLTLKTVINSISSKQKFNSTLQSIGSVVDDELRFSWLKKNEPNLFNKLFNQIQHASSYHHKRLVIVLAMNRAELGYNRLSKIDKLKVGSVLLGLLQETTGLIEIKTLNHGRTKRQKHILATETTLKWINNFNDYNQWLSPYYMPVTEKPVDWSHDSHPYNCLRLAKIDVIKSRPLETNKQGDLSGIYKALNYLQSTEWSINKFILDTFNYYLNNEIKIPALPSYKLLEVPAKPVDIDTNEEARRAWKQEASRTHKNNVRLGSKLMLTKQINYLANKFSKENHFYFPYQLDFRGRVYTIPTQLSPQGNELSRSLLTFKSAAPITPEGIKELKIYCANTYGIDKVSLNERYEWFNKNRKEIFRSASDPVQYKFWLDADKPWIFLAAAREVYEIETKNKKFTTLPVFIDGSNNGCQILSLLARDEELGFKTNCIDGHLPQDLYGFVAKNVLKALERSDDPRAKFWLEFGVDRKTCKKPVMIVPYSGTIDACKKYIKDWFIEVCEARDIDPPILGRELFSHLLFLSNIVWSSIHEEMKSALGVMGWLQDLGRLNIKEKKHITWTTPLGLNVYQVYHKELRKRIKTAIGESFFDLTLKLPDEHTINTRKHVNGISPNFVHSLDASALLQTVLNFKHFNYNSLCVIHDSFATHVTYINELASSVRMAYYNIFKEDQLLNLSDQISERFNLAVHDLPEYGKLDVSELLNSRFFFA